MECAKLFTYKLDLEYNNLEGMCHKWQNILNTYKYIPEDIKDQIRITVGQTTLLLNEKLKQFRDLIKKYEKGVGDANITPDDIEGFWDLVLIQVNDVKDKFSSLERSATLFR